jgi:hypothetical protein
LVVDAALAVSSLSLHHQRVSLLGIVVVRRVREFRLLRVAAFGAA